MKQEEVNKKVSLSIQAKDEELSVLKSVSMYFIRMYHYQEIFVLQIFFPYSMLYV